MFKILAYIILAPLFLMAAIGRIGRRCISWAEKQLTPPTPRPPERRP